MPAAIAEAVAPSEAATEYVACSLSCRYFLERYGRVLDSERGGVVPFEMWPHLVDLLEAWQRERRVIVLKARQIGVSWLVAGYALWTAKFRDGANVLILSKGQGEASDVLGHARFMESLLPPWLRNEAGKDNDSTLSFPTLHARIKALPATKSAGRSETASLVLLDEYAFFEYAEQNFAAIWPTTSAGGQMIIVSTANGLGNSFQRKWDEAARGVGDFLPIFLRWDVRPGRDAAWLAQQVAALGPALAKQEYPFTASEAFLVSGRPVFTEGLVLDPSLVPIERARETDWGELLPPGAIAYRAPISDHQYLLGADVAQGLAHGDASAAVVFDLETGEEVAHLHERVAPDLFADHLHLLGNTYPGVLGVERNNHGFAVLQRMRELHGARYLLSREVAPLVTATDFEVPVRAGEYGWLTTARSKPLMIAELEEATRKGLVRFGTPELLGEMRHYQRQDNGDTSAPQGMFDDRVVAAAIAWQMRKRIVEADDQPRRVRLEGVFS